MRRLVFTGLAVVLILPVSAFAQASDDVSARINERFRTIAFPVVDAQNEAIRCAKPELASAFEDRLLSLAMKARTDIGILTRQLEIERSRMKGMSAMACNPSEATKAFDSATQDFDYIEKLLKQQAGSP